MNDLVDDTTIASRLKKLVTRQRKRTPHKHEWITPCLAGVLNITPDSFSDGGRFNTLESALLQAQKLHQNGASIIDVGGQSTGPGSTPISAQEEQDRIVEIVTKLAMQYYLSIDTYYASTADTCLELGAKMINDVSGLTYDPSMASVIAAHQAYVVIMYCANPGKAPHAPKTHKIYNNITQEIIEFLDKQINLALSSGIKEDKILIDPGMGGFLSPKAEYSWEVLGNIETIKERFPSLPLYIGTSRKGFLSVPMNERDPLSQLTALSAYLQGADVIRTHNVLMAQRFFEIWHKINPVLRHPT